MSGAEGDPLNGCYTWREEAIKFISDEVQQNTIYFYDDRWILVGETETRYDAQAAAGAPFPAGSWAAEGDPTRKIQVVLDCNDVPRGTWVASGAGDLQADRLQMRDVVEVTPGWEQKCFMESASAVTVYCPQMHLDNLMYAYDTKFEEARTNFEAKCAERGHACRAVRLHFHDGNNKRISKHHRETRSGSVAAGASLAAVPEAAVGASELRAAGTSELVAPEPDLEPSPNMERAQVSHAFAPVIP